MLLSVGYANQSVKLTLFVLVRYCETSACIYSSLFILRYSINSFIQDLLNIAINLDAVSANY